MRIFSPLAVPGLCVTIGRYWYLFKRLTLFSAGRFYRFEHIVANNSGKVVAKWLHRRPQADGENATHRQASPKRLKKFFNT
jgi:hypothetical protein